MLNKLITSKTRLRLLIKFFISQTNRGYLNGLAAEMGESTNSIRKELNHLFDAGYLNKVKKDNKVEYLVNSDHPLYETLRKVVLKHLGLEDIVENVLDRIGNVKKIILIGDYAEGKDTGSIEIILVGKLYFDINTMSRVFGYDGFGKQGKFQIVKKYTHYKIIQNLLYYLINNSDMLEK